MTRLSLPAHHTPTHASRASTPPTEPLSEPTPPLIPPPMHDPMPDPISDPTPHPISDPVPDPIIIQAKRDIDAGMVDTDMRATPGLDAQQRRKLVPGSGGKIRTSGG